MGSIIRPDWAGKLLGTSAVVVALIANQPSNAVDWAPAMASAEHFDTALFGKKFRLDDNRSLNAYISGLEAQIDRSKREQKQGEGHEKDPLHYKLPKNYIDKKMRQAIEETRDCARQAAQAQGEERQRTLRDLWVMAGGIRASYLKVLPPDMDVVQALARQNQIIHPPVGLGNHGVAQNLSGTGPDPSLLDPVLPSSYWNKPKDIAHLDLYHGFGRTEIPDLDDVICTYDRSKQSRGVHPGYEVKAGKHNKLKVKFGEQFSQPFAHRIFWALGFNVPPADCVRTLKVKWDPQIVTEYNVRQDETVNVWLFGLILVAREHLQHNLDPFDPVAEIVMRDEQGRVNRLQPNPTWDEFKKKLYKDPRGRAFLKSDNINTDFADRIQYLVYHNVNIRPKGSGAEDEDEEDSSATYLGNWDLDGEGNPDMRENRGYAFASAWISQFDPPADNQKLYIKQEKDGRRLFQHVYTDLGGSLGPATDSRHMIPQLPNEFPWSFTRPTRTGETALPLDGSFRPIMKCGSFVNADIHDARWISRYIAQLTGDQILQALIATNMPSSEARIFYDKLVKRRNKALADLGLDYPPLKPLDEREDFDYDPRKDGLISVVTSHGEKVTAADDNMVIVKGRLYSRSQVESGFAAKDIEKANRHKP